MEIEKDIDFNNLENAFAYKNDSEIIQAYWLFKAMGIGPLVKYGGSLATAALKAKLPVGGLIKSTIFKQFCGGENINDCAKTVAKLGKFNVGSILDYSVEGKEEESEFDHSCDEIVATVRFGKNDPNIPFSVFKVTGLARLALLEKKSSGVKLTETETAEFKRIEDRVNRICEEGYKSGLRIFIDAEESWIQQAIDDLATLMMQRYNHDKPVIYNTIQFYRHDRIDFLKKSLAEAEKGNYWYGLKLVRGAYMEKERKRASDFGYPSPIQPDKESSDRDYDSGLKMCIEHIDRVAICAGTHNEESSMYLVKLMQEKGIPHDDTRIYFSQLLGMSDHISFNLAKAGYNVAKYVPYGPVDAVLPYLNRRAQENSSMSGQMSRELSLITTERQRRKNNS